MTDWTTIGFQVGAVVAGALISSKVAVAVFGEKIKGHGTLLNKHDELHKETAVKFDNLKNEFLPRSEAALQFNAVKDSQARMETYLRYLAFGERPSPPSL